MRQQKKAIVSLMIMLIEFLSIASIVRTTVVPAAALSDRVPPEA